MSEPVSTDLPWHRVHMIGIGGAGMSGVARILLERGVAVSGSDARDSATLTELAGLGAQVRVGHDATALGAPGAEPDVVVVSKAAIPQENPELVAARDRGIPVVTRSEVLGRLALDGRSILVCGTHGKTSTTSMVLSALLDAGLDPSFAVGGTVLAVGTNAHGGRDPLFVAEADESDGSLVHYSPDVVVLTNAEPDHLDHFGTAEAYYEVFDTFLARIPATGVLVACLDDPGAAERARRAAAAGVRVLGYGSELPEGTDSPLALRLSEVAVDSAGTTATVDAAADGPAVGVTHLRVGAPGAHMALNAAGALLAMLEVARDPRLPADADRLGRGLADFGGVGRRFEAKGSAGGVEVVDDYAHHPTEVEAVLTAARAVVRGRGRGRLVVVFQPHLYSRTRIFAAEFGQALSLADEVVVTGVYGAREQPEPGVDEHTVARHVTAAVHPVPDLDAARAQVLGLVRPGDLVFTVGAGDVTTLGPALLAALGASGADPR